MLSLAVKDDEQGTAASVLANVETLCGLVAPGSLGQLYGRVDHRLPFLVLAVGGVTFCLLSLPVKPSVTGVIERWSEHSLNLAGSYLSPHARRGFAEYADEFGMLDEERKRNALRRPRAFSHPHSTPKQSRRVSDVVKESAARLLARSDAVGDERQCGGLDRRVIHE